ncbi:MAG: hypothetical protein ACLP5H_16615 [Desulfomonilaceae bacterium]
MGNETEINNGFRDYVIRGVATLVAILLYGWINFLLHPVATLLSGKVAVKQFENSDASYVVSYFGINFFSNFGIPALVLLIVLVPIWWKPIKYLIKFSGGRALMILFILITGTNTLAYYDKADYTEAYFILPNESAFFIPDVGANKDSQAQFGSEEYLKANKIAAKRFIVPHAKFSGSGLWNDFYVPTGRLIIVDRTPYNREWVKAAHRGTSPKDECFPCQSSEGLNITVEISIASSVLEENAARYLYYFGVKPPKGDRTKPDVIFASVFYGRTLTEIMDTVGRGKVQALICKEFTTRTLDQANAEAAKIMETVEKGATAFFASRGITLDYIGWAGTFSFDQPVQDAINRRYIAGQDVEVAKTLAPHTSTIQALAAAEALRTFASKSDGKLPTTVSLWWLPSSLSEFLGGLFKPGPERAASTGNAPKK